MRIHFETVANAVGRAFSYMPYPDYVAKTQLPYNEPAFKLVEPPSTAERVLISKKPEGLREIFVGFVDPVDNRFYMYSMNRARQINFVAPSSGFDTPVELPAFVPQSRRSKVVFVFDVCRVWDRARRDFVNVVIHDMGPVGYHAWLRDTYNLVTKSYTPYTSFEDIHRCMEEPADFPYSPENGVLFVMGDAPSMSATCFKYTPPAHARVYLRVEPVLTRSARLWKLIALSNNELRLFRTIPAPDSFYVPPLGAVVAFKVVALDDGSSFRFVPTHIRVDKQTPSAFPTIQRAIARARSNLRAATGGPAAPAAVTPADEEDDNAFRV